MEEKRSGFTLVELMIVLAIVAVVSTLAVMNLISSRKAGNEVSAIKTLRSLTEVQGLFRRLDPEGDGADYALTLDELVDGSGSAMLPAVRQEGAVNGGYVFQSIPADENGTAYDPAQGYGFCAYPGSYRRTGDSTFIVSADGTVWRRDNGGAAVGQWPASDPETAGWNRVE